MSKDRSPASIAPAFVRALHAYTPGLQPTEPGWIKLNTNENPYPPSPRVAEAIQRELGGALRLYPDPRSMRLRQAFAARQGLREDQVIVGNGSDDVLNLLVRAFAGGGRRVAFTVPSYSLYPVLVAIENGEAVTIEFGQDMRLPVDRLAGVDAPLLFLTSPNAPTGVAFPTVEIERLADAFPGLLVVDEAYADFAEENAMALAARHPRVVVTRTLSKSHGLAGLRVGFAAGHPDVIGLLDRVRDSYNVNRLSQAGALAALEDADYTAGVVARVKATREHVRTRLEAMGWFTYPSSANFLFSSPRTPDGRTGPDVARQCYEYLLSRKILVRYFPSHALTAKFLRITVGTDDEMQAFLEAIASWLSNA